MNTTPMGQTFYEEEAKEAFPGGCKCGPDGGGEFDWCQIYYDDPQEMQDMADSEKEAGIDFIMDILEGNTE